MERSMLAAKSSIMGVISKLLLIAMNFACPNLRMYLTLMIQDTG